MHIAERESDFPGVQAKEVALRVYPYGSRAAHVLGYVGAINDTEYKTLKNDGYSLEDQVGKDGVEKIFEKDLRGTPGSITLEVDSAGRVLRELDAHRRDPWARRAAHHRPSGAGAGRGLARHCIAERGRTRTPKDNPNHFAAPGGSVVVLDPTTGAVVAMASYPTFDPREFVGGVDPNRYQQLLDPTNNFPLTNRAIAGQYAPGSTFKMITAAAGLAVGVISSGTRFLDAGHYTVPDCKGEKCTFSNAGGEQNGVVTMPTALAASSDVYFYSIGADLWRFRDQYNLAIQDTATAYGFGAETGVPLPGEQEGRVPTPEQKQAAHDQNPTAFPFGQWFTGDNVNLAVGQGEMLTTPMQLANAYAAFANGGTVYSPNIVSRILDPTTGEGTVPRVDREIGPRVLRTVSLPPAVRDPILSGLIGAVTSANGTAAPVFSTFPLSQYPLAGKTGTAQTAGKEAQFDTSLFVGFGPVGSPKYVVAAVLEQSGFGAQAAAPVVRRVFDEPRCGSCRSLTCLRLLPWRVAAPLVVDGLRRRPSLFLGGRLMALADTLNRRTLGSLHEDPAVAAEAHRRRPARRHRAHQRHRPRGHLQRAHRRLTDAGLDPFYYVKRQGFALLVGSIALVIVASIDYRKLREWAPDLFVASSGCSSSSCHPSARDRTAARHGSRSGRSSCSRPSSPRSR